MVDEELIFFNDILLGIQIILYHTQEYEYDKSSTLKVNNIFIDFLILYCFSWTYFCLVGILLIYFCFHFFYFCVCFLFWLVLLLKAREEGRQNWVGREAGKIRDDLGKGKYCTKIFFSVFLLFPQDCWLHWSIREEEQRCEQGKDIWEYNKDSLPGDRFQ